MWKKCIRNTILNILFIAFLSLNNSSGQFLTSIYMCLFLFPRCKRWPVIGFWYFSCIWWYLILKQQLSDVCIYSKDEKYIFNYNNQLRLIIIPTPIIIRCRWNLNQRKFSNMIQLEISLNNVTLKMDWWSSPFKSI